MMHLVLQNNALLICGLWGQTKLANNRKNANLVSQPYHLDDVAIEGTGSHWLAVDRNSHFLRHASHPIDNGYKAAEWDAWLKPLGLSLANTLMSHT
jgi:hypothetical protein